MKNIILNLLILSYLTLSFTALAQKKSAYDINKKYSVAELKTDLATYKTQLEKVHTGLYVYHTKAEFDTYFQDLENRITEPMTDIEFHRLTFPLNTLIANGHTRPIPSIGYLDGVLFEWKVFPFAVYVDEGKLYVLRNLSDDTTIQEGAIIHQINGAKAMDVYHSFVDQIWRDGYNTSAPETDSYEIFSELYANLIGLPKSFELQIENPDGKKTEITITPQTMKAMKATRDIRYPNYQRAWEATGALPLELTIADNIATMTVRSWSVSEYKDYGQKFKKFFKQSFEQIEKMGVEHLILDFRNNGGGDPKPTIALFAHLHPESFTFYKEVSTNLEKIEDNELYGIDFGNRMVQRIAFKKKGNKYVPNWIARAAGLKGLKPAKRNKTVFNGKVYVLTNASSFSATGEMTSIIKSHNRATFIGEEPGGNPNTNTSGLQAVLTLPNTGNRIVMPFWQWEMNTTFENTGYGVKPDYPVRPNIQDMMDGKDVVMEFTLDLIQQNNHGDVGQLISGKK